MVEHDYSVVDEQLADFEHRLTEFYQTPTGQQEFADQTPFIHEGTEIIDAEGGFTEWAEDATGWDGLAGTALEIFRSDREETQLRLKEARQRQVEEYQRLKAWNEFHATSFDGGAPDYQERIGDTTDESEYDDEGYSVVTGADKHGFGRDGIHVETGTRYDMQGRDCEGYDRDGLDILGYDRNRFNAIGRHRDTGLPTDADGYTKEGWNLRTGLNRETGTKFDAEGYDQRGCDAEGWTRLGWNRTRTLNKFTGTKYDEDGFDFYGVNSTGGGRDGSSSSGFRRDRDRGWIHRDTRTRWNAAGFDHLGRHKDTGKFYDKQGYDANGYDKEGYNRKGFLNPEEITSGTGLEQVNGVNDFLARHNITERRAWRRDPDSKQSVVRVLVDGAFHYRQNPARILFNVVKAAAHNKRTRETLKFYTLTPKNGGKSYSFSSPKQLEKFLRTRIGKVTW